MFSVSRCADLLTVLRLWFCHLTCCNTSAWRGNSSASLAVLVPAMPKILGDEPRRGSARPRRTGSLSLVNPLGRDESRHDDTGRQRARGAINSALLSPPAPPRVVRILLVQGQELQAGMRWAQTSLTNKSIPPFVRRCILKPSCLPLD